MKRREEAEEGRFQNLVEIGLENQQWLDGMSKWCSHFEMTRTSFGMYAEQTGLPIASFRVGCPKIKTGGSEGMHLSWSCSRFLVDHCYGCAHHNPDGDKSWGERKLKEILDQKREQQQEQKKRDEKIERLRTALGEQSSKIQEESASESTQVVSFLEQVFENDVEKRKIAIDRLLESAKIAGDLFPEKAIELIIELSGSKDYGTLLLPISLELAKHRDAYSKQFSAMAIRNIENVQNLDRSCEVLSQVKKSIVFPLNDKAITSLLNGQRHDFRATHLEHVSYLHVTNILVSCFDVDEKQFYRIAKVGLSSENEGRRRNVCGAIQLVQAERPKIVFELLESLLEALKRVESVYEDRPSGKIVQILQYALNEFPEEVDDALAKTMASQRPAVCEDVVRVYRKLFLSSSGGRRMLRQRSEISRAEKNGLARLMLWIKDKTLDLEIRIDVLEVLELACKHSTTEAFTYFDSLLGYYAIVCQMDGPPKSPPKIILPNDPPADPQLKLINQRLRQQHWEIFKRRLRTSLSNLCEAMPKESFDSVAGCLETSETTMGDEFKACCITLLGELGKEYLLRPRVLPLIMKGLMDYDSAYVRSTAIDSAVEMFTYSNATPPNDLVDVVALHLKDTFVIVHRSAVQAVRRHPSWFNDQQAVEAIQVLPALLKSYGNDPYQLEEICEAILSLAGRRDWLKKYALTQVESVLPTEEEYPDEGIVKEMLRRFSPSDQLAGIVAVHVADCLGRYQRERYNEDTERNKMFDWLYNLPSQNYLTAEKALAKAGQKLAKKDGWDSAKFAAVFSNMEAFNCESETLATALVNIPVEPRTDSLRNMLENLYQISVGNQALQSSDLEQANNEFKKVRISQDD